jgi:hypothetical protein
MGELDGSDKPAAPAAKKGTEISAPTERDRFLDDILNGNGRGLTDFGTTDKGFFDKSKGKFDFGASLDGLYGSGDSGSQIGKPSKEFVPSDKDYEILRGFLKDAPAATPSPGMKPGEVADEIRKIFPRLNANGDDRVDLNEMHGAVKNPAYTGRSAQALAALYGVMRNDPYGSVTMDGISKFAKLDRLPEVRPALEKVAGLARALDAGGAEPVTKESLKVRIAETQDPAKKEVLQDAFNSFDQLKQLSGSDGDGITSAGLRKLTGLPYHYEGDGAAKQLAQISQRVADSQKHDGKTLFGDYGGFLGFFQNTGIVPEAVQQGIIHDCNLFAPLMSLAKVAPEEIRNMIKDNGDGKYTVTFPGAKDQPITIAAPTQAELGLYSQLTKFGTWPAVIEKAYGEFVRKNPGFAELRFAPCAEGAPSAECLSQGGYDEGLRILTGNETNILGVGKGGASNQEISEQLAAGIKDGKVMTIASEPKRFNLSNIESLHNYSIVGFDKNGPGGGTVTLLDPYGTKSKAKDATLKVSVDQLAQDFDWIAIEQRRASR